MSLTTVPKQCRAQSLMGMLTLVDQKKVVQLLSLKEKCHLFNEFEVPQIKQSIAHFQHLLLTKYKVSVASQQTILFVFPSSRL